MLTQSHGPHDTDVKSKYTCTYYFNISLVQERLIPKMSETREGRAISAMDAAPGDTPPIATVISAAGQHGIPVLFAPFHQLSGATASFQQGFLVLHGHGEAKEDDGRSGSGRCAGG